MAINISAQVKNYDKLLKHLHGIEQGGKQALTDTVNDLKRRAPTWVAKEVTKRYGISNAEVNPSSTKKDKNGNKIKLAGYIGVRGNTLETLAINYSGHMLTPVHFKMTPTEPVPGKKYRITAEILKGKRASLSRKAYLGNTGAKEGDEEKIHFIPFQRVGKSRLPIKPIKTVSVPQMVDNEDVRAEIDKRLGEGLQKRLEHNVQRRL
jgi:hypothetical protein